MSAADTLHVLEKDERIAVIAMEDLHEALPKRGQSPFSEVQQMGTVPVSILISQPALKIQRGRVSRHGPCAAPTYNLKCDAAIA